MERNLADGIVSRLSRYLVDQTVDRILEVLGEKEVKVFAVVDHHEALAAKVVE